MAALSSTQSGNWTSSSTWGGSTPADGDTFTINRGHKVTVNSDVTVTNGYGDISVYGNLHFATNATILINGMLRVYGNDSYAYNNSTSKWFIEGDNTTAGLLSSAGNNIEIIMRGANADNHGIWIENQNWASMKLEADEKKTTTALSSAVTLGDSYLTVDSVTGIAKEDWVAVYREGNQDGRANNDEGFWVHDVDSVNKRIYIRLYVSPTATISSATNRTIRVNNARVFRVGYKIIFGTGNNRNVKTITALDYDKNTVTVDSNVSGTVTGEIIYQTGAERPHVIDDAVQRIATTLTTAVTANATNQITVGDATDFSVGDTIVVDVDNDNDFGWNYQAIYTISSKSGNTLTLNTNLAHNRKVGSIVQNLSRHMKIRGYNSVDSETRVFLYVEYWTDFSRAHTRHIMLKNIEFYQFGGNTNSTYYRGVMIAGYNSHYQDDASDTDWRYKFQSKIQGCSIHSSNRSDSYQGLTSRHCHYLAFRNNAAVDVGNHPFWIWSSNHNYKFTNNYSTWGQYCNVLFDSVYEPYTDIGYFYGTRSEDYGTMVHHFIEAIPFRHFIMKNQNSRPFYIYYTMQDNQFDRIYMDGYTRPPLIGNRNGAIHFTDSYLGNRWARSFDGTLGTDQLQTSRYFSLYSDTDDRWQYYRTTGRVGHSYYHDVNFQDGTSAETFGAGMVYTDYNGVSYFYGNNDDNGVMWANSVYVPAGTTVRISGKLKTDGGSYTYPYLFAKNRTDGYNRGRYRTGGSGQTSILSDASSYNSRAIGWNVNQQFSANMKTDWEEEQITVSAQDYPYMLIYGYFGYGNMGEEKCYFTEPVIRFNIPPVGRGRTANGKVVKIRSSFTSAKKRIGGTRL